jgi:hypothetical protein
MDSEEGDDWAGGDEGESGEDLAESGKELNDEENEGNG